MFKTGRNRTSFAYSELDGQFKNEPLIEELLGSEIEALNYVDEDESTAMHHAVEYLSVYSFNHDRRGGILDVDHANPVG